MSKKGTARLLAYFPEFTTAWAVASNPIGEAAEGEAKPGAWDAGRRTEREAAWGPRSWYLFCSYVVYLQSKLNLFHRR